jgi:hypothetical protein
VGEKISFARRSESKTTSVSGSVGKQAQGFMWRGVFSPHAEGRRGHGQSPSGEVSGRMAGTSHAGSVAGLTTQ